MASVVTARRNLSLRLEGEVGSGGRDHCWVLPLSHSYSSQSWLKQGTKEEERSKMLPCSTKDFILTDPVDTLACH